MTWETGEWSMEEAKDIVRRGMGVVEDDHAAVEAPFMLEAAIKEIDRLSMDAELPMPECPVPAEDGQWIATLETGERVAVWPEQVGLNMTNYLPHGAFRYPLPGSNKSMGVVDLHGPGQADPALTDLAPLLGMSFTFDRARDVTLCAKCGARTVKPKGGLPVAWTHQVPGTRPEDCRMLCDACAAKAKATLAKESR